MLRYRHRRSKDIDIFVPDPQYLGYVSPRLSEVAEAISADYVEGAGFVKRIRPEGEIDFVASLNLTATSFETWSLQRRPVRVETAAEPVAKRLWHRGDQVSVRDLFDLSLVIEQEPERLRERRGAGSARQCTHTECNATRFVAPRLDDDAPDTSRRATRRARFERRSAKKEQAFGRPGSTRL